MQVSHSFLKIHRLHLPSNFQFVEWNPKTGRANALGMVFQPSPAASWLPHEPVAAANLSQPAQTADLTQVYAMIPFLNVLFTYGLETAYFRFSQDQDQRSLYNTLPFRLSSHDLFTGLLYLSAGTIAGWANLEKHPEYITWMAGIIFFDAISTLAFACLRQENRPKRYAFARISGSS